MVNFNANGGIGGVPGSVRVNAGDSITVPGGGGLSLGNSTFTGWFIYSDGKITNYSVGESFTPPGGHITLFARWDLDADNLDSISGLANKLAWLQNNAENAGNYIIEVNANESLGHHTLFFPGRNNITITLRGNDTDRIISSAVNYSTFTVLDGATLILDNNITLQGNRSTERAVVVVTDGVLVMNNGSSVTGNGHHGVRVNSGTFTMNEGEITENRFRGVVIGPGDGRRTNARFVMNGGTISGNSGGIILSTGTFDLNGGTISGNTSPGAGGGLWIQGGVFNMSGGEITQNLAHNTPGVGVVSDFLGAGRFNMSGGIISGNTLARYPRGTFPQVAVPEQFFRQTGGIIRP